MNEIRWGIVGTGDVSAAIVPDFELVFGARLTAVCSRSQARADQFATEHGIARRFTDLGSMLDSGAIDALYIATPHGTHHPIALQAIGAGIHVMIEKPISTHEHLVRDIFDRAAAAGCFAMEAMWMMYSPTIAGLRQAVASGEIGEVRSVRASFGVPFPRDSGSRWSAELGGSTLLDQGIYAVTLAGMLLGELNHATGWARVEAGVDVTVHADLEYADGRFAQIAASAVEYIDLTASINGTSGWITLDAPFWATDRFSVHTPATSLLGADQRRFDLEGNGFAPMIREATLAILSGSLVAEEHSPAQCLSAFRQLGAIRSAVRLSDDPNRKQVSP